MPQEVPDQEEEEEEEEEASYNELQCEYCHQGYANPSDWVRHMTEHHGDRGYQTYKDMEKDVRIDIIPAKNYLLTKKTCRSAQTQSTPASFVLPFSFLPQTGQDI